MTTTKKADPPRQGRIGSNQKRTRHLHSNPFSALFQAIRRNLKRAVVFVACRDKMPEWVATLLVKGVSCHD